MPPTPRSDAQVLTPSGLNRRVRDLLEDSLPLIWIEGELSNLARPASGHLYFTLKDSQAQVRCAMFKPKSSWLKFKPADGMHVLLRARVGFYEPRGEFQLIVEHMEPAGEGALQREFEQLKARLAQEGLFASEHKRPLPAYLRRIAVITSPSGAAIRDVLSVWARRFPLVDAEILPVPVQGREAAPAMVAMLHKAVASDRYDAILLTRGGGSMEDLWCFNDEALARAIHASKVPVVSAVGHEIDFTIADLVADLRAPTPSAAAELLVPDRDELLHRLQQWQSRLDKQLRHQLTRAAQQLDHLQIRLQGQRPSARLQRGHERLEQLRLRLLASWASPQQARRRQLEHWLSRWRLQDPQRQLQHYQPRLEGLGQRLQRTVQQSLELQQQRLRQAGHSLHASSPLATLERGYAILLDADRQVVRSRQAVQPGQPLRARLADGELDLQVIDSPS
ncbi:exodeoxyribonuclease VII large subunit [Frateuria aurantia]